MQLSKHATYFSAPVFGVPGGADGGCDVGAGDGGWVGPVEGAETAEGVELALGAWVLGGGLSLELFPLWELLSVDRASLPVVGAGRGLVQPMSAKTILAGRAAENGMATQRRRRGFIVAPREARVVPPSSAPTG
jgi:hypothetical protein